MIGSIIYLWLRNGCFNLILLFFLFYIYAFKMIIQFSSSVRQSPIIQIINLFITLFWYVVIFTACNSLDTHFILIFGDYSDIFINLFVNIIFINFYFIYLQYSKHYLMNNKILLIKNQEYIHSNYNFFMSLVSKSIIYLMIVLICIFC